MLTFEEYKKERDSLMEQAKSIGAQLHAYPRGEMGLVKEEIRVTEQYKATRKLYQHVFNMLRNLNGKYIKIYKTELAAERATRQYRMKKPLGVTY